MATFITATRIVTGWGASADLGRLAAVYGRQALLITGRSALRGARVTERLRNLLRASGVEAGLFDQVQPEPTTDAVDAVREVIRRSRCDVVLAAGGGSVIDVGKAAAALAFETSPTAEYFSLRPVPERGLPFIALPTTAGTGAEVTLNSVLTDPKRGVKESIRGEALMPAVAIVDGELTVACPPDVTAASGLDALTQAIESYWSRGATELTDCLAFHAAELVWANLRKAWRDGRDQSARQALSEGALLAGMALANARLGAVHGVAHPLGLKCRIAHGVVCAAMLPHVMRFNRPAVAAKYDRLAGVMGMDPIEAVERLLDELKLPRRLGPLGLRAEDIPEIARQSMPSGSLKANPRSATEQDIRDLLSQAL